MSNDSLGQSIPRLEDPRFLTGQGCYTDDMYVEGQLHAVVLRSPHAHADILAIDLGAAREQAGVVGVYTEADLRADDIGPLPCVAVIDAVSPLVIPPRYALACGRVRHVGDPVAFVVAESRQAASEAAELIEVEYEALPAVVDAVHALGPEAPEIWSEAAGNLAFRFQKGDRQAAEAVIGAAAHVVEIELINNRVSPAPLEPRAAIGWHDPAADALTLTLTGQGVHGIRRQLADSVFKLPHERLNVKAPDVGGGFGMKNFVYPESVLVLWAARRLGRPVRWLAERSEDFVSGTQGRDLQAKARLALDAEGRFLALSAAMTANMGAYLSANGPGSSTNSPSTAMSGIYVIPEVFMDVRGAFTNTVPIDAYRGAGKPEANYIIERLIDLAARQTGFDRVDLRRRNAIHSFPHQTALGMNIDSGGFRANIEAAVHRADREGFEARRAEAAKSGRLRGIGVACFLETARGTPGEGAEIKFTIDGKVELLVGTESNGQGHETTYPQVAAARLGLPIDSFRYVQADTAKTRTGRGHGGARSMHMGGGALVMAIDAVLDKARGVAARLLQAGDEALEFADGHFVVESSERAVSLLEVAAAAREAEFSPDGSASGLDTFVMNESDLFTFPSGCHVAEVEIDRDTGALAILRYLIVDDYGRLLNPTLTAGQVQGGVAQGIGQATGEIVAYDPKSAQLLSGSLMDYWLPRAADLPPFEVHFEERPTGANPLGVKGSGQAGCIGAPQTVMSAVLDALAPLGIDRLDMPATSERIWRAITATENT